MIGLHGINREVTTDANADVKSIRVDDFAVCSRLGILRREPAILASIINHDDLGIVDMPVKRLDQPVA